MFWPFRGRQRRRHGRDVPVTSGATLTRAWAGRRLLCSDYFGGNSDKGHRRGHAQAGVSYVLATSGSHRRGHGQAGVSYVPAASGATLLRAWAGRCLLCSGYFGGYIDEGMGR